VAVVVVRYYVACPTLFSDFFGLQSEERRRNVRVENFSFNSGKEERNRRIRYGYAFHLIVRFGGFGGES